MQWHITTHEALEAIEAAIQAMPEAVGPTKIKNASFNASGMSTKNSEPALKKMTFKCKAKDKYNEQLNSEMEVKYIHDEGAMIYVTVRVPVSINWLG